MSQENYRTICSITGLAIGVALMIIFGFEGLVPGFFFGAGGAVVGGMIGDVLFARSQR